MKVERPKVTKGITIKKVTGCGNMYVTVNEDEDSGEVIEVFATLGKNGGCSRCQNEALTRAITMGLKYGASIGEFAEELKGIQCSSPHMWPREERTLSCPDAIARALEEYSEIKDK